MMKVGKQMKNESMSKNLITKLKIEDFYSGMLDIFEVKNGKITTSYFEPDGKILLTGEHYDGFRLISNSRNLRLDLKVLTVKKDELICFEAVDERSYSALSEFDEKSQEYKLPTIPQQYRYTEKARKSRISFIEEECNIELKYINKSRINPEILKGIHGNNIGSVEIPLGIAGPLLFKGLEVKETVFAPIATCEGALIESITRGSVALSRSGGVKTRVVHQYMNRAPIFEFYSVDEAINFCEWLNNNFDGIFEVASMASSHGRLMKITTNVFGNLVHAKFYYNTNDAAGQNMTTLCTWTACQWILEKLNDTPMKVKYHCLEGNLSSDKKVSYDSYLNGRGIRAIAEARLDRRTLKEVFNITPEALVEGYYYGITGGIGSGMIGYNINSANVIAAIFTATGQDIASTHESGCGYFYVKMENDYVYASMTLPNLVIGTIGGGTSLPWQKESLEILDCYGQGKVNRLAEIIAGFCLALDLSTMSAMATGVFASAHERLARKPTKLKILKEMKYHS